jgi:hypothetical protein
MAARTRARDWADVDFYGVLGVAENASEDDIGRAFRNLVKQLHPDAGATTAEIERFNDVVDAYAVLGNGRFRRDYDAVRSTVRPLRLGPAPARPMPPRPGSFRAAKPSRGWTRAHAWLALVGGIACIVLGAIVTVLVFQLRARAGQPGEVSDPARDITLAIVAAKLVIGGIVFIVLGAFRLRGRSVYASLFGPRAGPTAAR